MPRMGILMGSLGPSPNNFHGAPRHLMSVMGGLFERDLPLVIVKLTLNEHREWIMNETLTAEWSSTAFDTGFSLERELDDHQWRIALEKTARD